MPPVIIAAVGGAMAAAGSALAAGTLMTAATLTAMATSAAISASLAGAMMVLTPKQRPFRQELKDRTLTVRQSIQPRQIIYGQVRTGGPVVFMHVGSDGDNKNKWLHLIVVLASHEVEEIGDVYFNDKLLPLGADGFVESGDYYFDGDWGGRNPLRNTWERGMAYVSKHKGGPGQTALTGLTEPTGGKWTAEHVGVGQAYLYVRLEWKQEIFTSGIPNITAVVKGKKLYDPRDGATRYSTNAALVIRDFLSLSAQEGGLGATADEFDAVNLNAAANLCDELVPIDGGGTEARYTINGSVTLSSANTPRNTLEGLLSACSGTVLYSGGKWRLLPAAYRTPTITLSEADVRGGVSVTTRVSRRDQFSGIKGTYVSPANHWQPADYPPLQSDAMVAEIGGEPVWKEVDRAYTTSAATAQRLAKIDLLRARQPLTVHLPCKLTAFRCQAGDVINLSLARFGWVSKPFEVVEWKFAIDGEGALGVDLSLRETHPSVYDWATSEETVVDPAPATGLPDWRLVGEPRNLFVNSSASNVLEGADGSLISRAVVTWDEPLDGFVTGYELQWRLTGAADWTYTVTLRETLHAIDNMPVGALIDVRVRALNALGVPSNYAAVSGHTITGTSARANPVLTGLKAFGASAGSEGTFTTLDATFVVNPATTLAALLDVYVWEFRDGTSGTGALRRTVTTSDPLVTYLYSDNFRDGLARTFTVSVQARTKLGGLSPKATIVATNPVPAQPTNLSITGEFKATAVRYTPPAEDDWTGVLIWRGTTTGFARNSASLIYDGPDTFVATPAVAGQQYFLRVASYDAFGKVGLVESAEFTVTTVGILHSDLADEIVETSNLIPSLQTTIGKIDVIETGLSTEVTNRQTADSGLAARIDTIAATSAGFDAALAYRFGATVEGWTAVNATLAWQAGGTVRLAATTGDPMLISPAFSLAGSLNRIVKLRVTRIAGSGWDGTVYYDTPGHGHEGGYRKEIPNPNLAIGATTILSFDMGSLTAGGTDWTSSEIVGVRIDLGNSSADIFDLHWIALGAEAPAASTAAIVAEQIARADADTALASDITTLETTVGGHTSSIETQSTTLDGLSAQYTVKVQTDGYVSGFGLASTAIDGTPTSSFVVAADRFAIAKPGAGGIAPTIPFIVKTIGSTPTLSFEGSARFDKLEGGTLAGQVLYLGTTNLVLDGVGATIKVSNGTTDLVKLGQVSTGVYGIEIRDASSNLILSSGAGIGAGAVKATSLAVGTGVNVLYNSDAMTSLDAWQVHSYSVSGTPTLHRNLDASNTIPGAGLVLWQVVGSASGNVFDVANVGLNGYSNRYPVVAGQRYEASGYAGVWRATGVNVYVHWFNAAGASISESHGNTVTNNSGFTRLEQLGRTYVFATAPVGAVTALIAFRVLCNATANPVGVVTRAYFGQAGANQSELSAWSPGTGAVNLAAVSGAGALAAKNSVAYGTSDVTGFGSLAAANTVNWNTQLTNVPAFGNFAYLSSITSANISTYISSAAIGTAYISDAAITNAKIANVAANKLTADWIDAYGITTRNGCFTVWDGNNNRHRAWLGHMNGVDYGFWVWGPDGTEILTATDINGVKIRNLTVDGNTKLASLSVGGSKIEDLAASNSVGSTAVNVSSLGVAMTCTGKPVTIIVNWFYNLGSTSQGTTNRTIAADIISNGATLLAGVKSSSVDSDGAGTCVGSVVYTFTPAAGVRDFFIFSAAPGLGGNRMSIWAVENRK